MLASFVKQCCSSSWATLVQNIDLGGRKLSMNVIYEHPSVEKSVPHFLLLSPSHHVDAYEVALSIAG